MKLSFQMDGTESAIEERMNEQTLDKEVEQQNKFIAPSGFKESLKGKQEWPPLKFTSKPVDVMFEQTISEPIQIRETVTWPSPLSYESRS